MRYLLLCVFALSAVAAEAQEMRQLAPAANRMGTVYKQDVLYFDRHRAQVGHYSRNFDMTAYRKYADATATGCQVFKEQAQELWWANCGPPIKGTVVVYNMTD